MPRPLYTTPVLTILEEHALIEALQDTTFVLAQVIERLPASRQISLRVQVEKNRRLITEARARVAPHW